MVKLVIPTSTGDNEALIVAAALREAGDTAHIWYTGDYPNSQNHVLDLASRPDIFIKSDFDENVSWRDFDTCWLRNIYPDETPVIPVNPEDAQYVAATYRQHLNSMWQLLSSNMCSDSDVFWVNTLESARRAESKALQIVVARKCGFNVPETLITNDGAEVRSFLCKTSNGAVIRKSLLQQIWFEQGSAFSNSASIIQQHMIPSDRAISAHVEIYQEKIDKAFEVRVVFFGLTYVALQIDPADRGVNFIDWRIFHNYGLVSHSIIDLPASVYDSCVAMMASLSIVTGSFDLLVDRSGCYHFAEVNQGGLFLWMERAGAPLLDIFIDFLREGDPLYLKAIPQEHKLSVKGTRASQTYKSLHDQEMFRRSASIGGDILEEAQNYGRT